LFTFIGLAGFLFLIYANRGFLHLATGYAANILATPGAIYQLNAFLWYTTAGDNKAGLSYVAIILFICNYYIWRNGRKKAKAETQIKAFRLQPKSSGLVE
jgi:hypothetical protein